MSPARFDYPRKFCSISPVPTKGAFSGRNCCEGSISILPFLKTELPGHMNSLGDHLDCSEWQENEAPSSGGHTSEAQLLLILISAPSRDSSALQTLWEWWSRSSWVILSPFTTSPLKSACHSNTCDRLLRGSFPKEKIVKYQLPCSTCSFPFPFFSPGETTDR